MERTFNVSIIQLGGIETLGNPPPGAYFDLGVLKHFELKKSDKKNC